MNKKNGKVDGNSVVDASRKQHFEVYERDVKIASRKDRFTCPISYAITRRLGAKQASVTAGVTLVQFGNSKIYRRFRTSKKMREALVRFDKTGEFEPDAFELAPFSDSHKLGSRFETTGKGAPKRRVTGTRFEKPSYRGK